MARLFVLLLVTFFLSACGSSPSESRFSGAIMGTSYSVKLITEGGLSDADYQRIAAEIQETLSRVDRLMSTYKPDSEVSVFNRTPVDTEVTLSSPTFEVIAASKRLYEMSEGAFDITVGPLVNLWGFGPDGRLLKVPSEERLTEVLQQVGSNRFKLNVERGSIVKEAELAIDLSAIAKGYAVDQVADVLSGQGLRDYLVEVGGEIRISGLNLSRSAWVLGVELPDALGRQAHTVIGLKEGAMATSGDYRNFYQVEGERYSHTIDPETGFPARHHLASVTVVAETCAEADALATALMVMGEHKGLAFAKKYGVQALFLVRTSEGFEVLDSGKFNELVLN